MQNVKQQHAITPQLCATLSAVRCLQNKYVNHTYVHEATELRCTPVFR
jgi:hypothetical protein